MELYLLVVLHEKFLSYANGLLGLFRKRVKRPHLLIASPRSTNFCLMVGSFFASSLIEQDNTNFDRASTCWPLVILQNQKPWKIDLLKPSLWLLRKHGLPADAVSVLPYLKSFHRLMRARQTDHSAHPQLESHTVCPSCAFRRHRSKLGNAEVTHETANLADIAPREGLSAIP